VMVSNGIIYDIYCITPPIHPIVRRGRVRFCTTVQQEGCKPIAAEREEKKKKRKRHRDRESKKEARQRQSYPPPFVQVKFAAGSEGGVKPGV